jgi:hypothetical protein
MMEFLSMIPNGIMNPTNGSTKRSAHHEHGQDTPTPRAKGMFIRTSNRKIIITIES